MHTTPFRVGFILLAIPCLAQLADAAQPPAAQPAPAPAAEISLRSWAGSHPPFSFRYAGKPSAEVLAQWQRTETSPTRSEGGETRHYTYFDPVTHLKVIAEVRTFARYDAVDWVLRFSNLGSADTPLIEAIQPLDWNMAAAGDVVLHHARGSFSLMNDFEPLTDRMVPGKPVHLASKGGRSSNETLPFFNLEAGAGGVVGAIGWTGNWSATFQLQDSLTGLGQPSSERYVSLQAGMKATHLRLHPGETIRTPRILLLNWHGSDWSEAQNRWRRLMLAYYSPQDKGQPLVGPVCAGSWGVQPAATKIAQIQMIHERGLPFSVYWIDAGWYGTSQGTGEVSGDSGSSPWWRSRGSWIPNKINFPHGLTPVGKAAAKAGLGFLVWIEPETVMAGTVTFTEHPDWVYDNPNAAHADGPDLINLGDPQARQGLTELVSNLLTEQKITWLRQDFNTDPEPYWRLADAPDRVGMAEIRHIEGLYQFWDDLRARHPGLTIDNCASGGRCLDIETMSRSIALWRSDLMWGPFDPIGSQGQTQGLAPWVPLNGGVDGRATANPPWRPVVPPSGDDQLYAMRSGYSTAFISSTGPVQGASDSELTWLKRVLTEYREVQPFAYADFYPLQPYTLAKNAWTAWQWDRPEHGDGCVIVLRRPENAASTVQLGLQALRPDASYAVEIRHGLGKAPIKYLSGKELGQLEVTVPLKPGSVLVFYSRRPDKAPGH